MAGNVVETVQNKAREVAQEDFDRAKVLFKDATRSGSYLYPIKGIFYFASHKSLWKPFISKLIPTLGLSVGVVASMFAFAYVPQLAVLVFVNGPLAVLTTVILILSESSTIISVLTRSFLLKDTLLDVFDGTLVSRDATNIVGEGRQLKAGGDPMARLGKILKTPFSGFSPKAIVRYIMYLPLNFIPVVGTVMFVLLQGRARGTAAHERYFQLKRWSASQRSEWLKEHVGAYSGFGTVATLLEMIPFASIVFSFTNTVGAALWAADIEQKENEMSSGTAPGLREAAKKAE